MTINKSVLTSIYAIYSGLRKSLLLVAVFLPLSCTDWPTNNILSGIDVELWYQQQELSCGQSVERDTLNWSIDQLAFFISDLRLLQAEKEVPLILSTTDSQSDNIALIRFTRQDCVMDNLASTAVKKEDSSQALFKRVQFVQPVQLNDDSHLRFTLGLPFEVNHLNPLSQPSPLNIPSMFWSWRGGHKFLRLDMAAEGQAWDFHLGSTGCVSASAMRSPQAACINPNTMQLTLAKHEHGERLVIHLDKLLQGLELNNKSSCLMQPDKASCQQLMANLANNEVFEWR